jgi:hypothetical protein
LTTCLKPQATGRTRYDEELLVEPESVDGEPEFALAAASSAASCSGVSLASWVASSFEP